MHIVMHVRIGFVTSDKIQCVHTLDFVTSDKSQCVYTLDFGTSDKIQCLYVLDFYHYLYIGYIESNNEICNVIADLLALRH